MSTEKWLAPAAGATRSVALTTRTGPATRTWLATNAAGPKEKRPAVKIATAIKAGTSKASENSSRPTPATIRVLDRDRNIRRAIATGSVRRTLKAGNVGN